MKGDVPVREGWERILAEGGKLRERLKTARGEGSVCLTWLESKSPPWRHRAAKEKEREGERNRLSSKKKNN